MAFVMIRTDSARVIGSPGRKISCPNRFRCPLVIPRDFAFSTYLIIHATDTSENELATASGTSIHQILSSIAIASARVIGSFGRK